MNAMTVFVLFAICSIPIGILLTILSLKILRPAIFDFIDATYNTKTYKSKLKDFETPKSSIKIRYLKRCLLDNRINACWALFRILLGIGVVASPLLAIVVLDWIWT